MIWIGIIFSLIVLYIAYDKTKVSRQAEVFNHFRNDAITMADQAVDNKMQLLVNRDTELREKIMQNQSIVRENSRWIYEIKESVVNLYDERKEFQKLMEDVISTNGTYELIKLNQSNSEKLQYLSEYFQRTFRVTPEEYKLMKKNVIGYYPNGDPYPTQHSIN